MNSVYFVRPVGQLGPVKVGFTSLIRERIAALNAWSPIELEVAAVTDGSRELERRFHALFLPDRVRGEWFRSSKRMEAVIAALNAETFDFSTLPEPIVLPQKRPTVVSSPEREPRIQEPGLLNDIKSFCSLHGIGLALFGRAAINDPALTRGLEQGRAPRSATVARIRTFMQSYRPAASTPKPRRQQVVAS